jgi:hypothetical protein
MSGKRHTEEFKMAAVKEVAERDTRQAKWRNALE